MTPGDNKPIVLFVDDDEDDFLQSKEAFLEAWPDCEVRWAENGQQMLDYLSSTNRFAGSPNTELPSLIISDLSMPFMNGREALKEVKMNPKYKQIPFLIMSATLAEKDVHFCYENKANAFINKPFDHQKLVSVYAGISKYWLKTMAPHARTI